MKYIEIVSADKLYQDGVQLVRLNWQYRVHDDIEIGEFIIGSKGRYGVIDMRSLRYYQENYGWVIKTYYS